MAKQAEANHPRIKFFTGVDARNWVQGSVSAAGMFGKKANKAKRVNRLEKDIENYLRLQVKDRGGMAYKFSSPNHRSVPDRMIVFPDLVMYAEVKMYGKKPTPKQWVELERLADYKQLVCYVDSMAGVDVMLQTIDRMLARLQMVKEVMGESDADSF